MIGTPFITLQQVDSTNNYATEKLHARMAQHGTVVFAHSQTAGRGQRSKQWLSEAGTNLAMSVVVEPAPLDLSKAFFLSMAVACAAARFLMQYVGDEVRVKWPNDLYWRDRKAGGILIENSIQGAHWKAAVVGIGINVNQTQFAPHLGGKAVSIKQITGKDADPLLLAKELCPFLQQSLEELDARPDAIKAEYHQLLYKRNEVVQLRKGPVVFAAPIEGVNDFGQLITRGATQQIFSVGEVEWIF